MKARPASEPSPIQRLTSLILVDAVSKNAAWLELVLKEDDDEDLFSGVYYCIDGRKEQGMKIPYKLHEHLIDEFIERFKLEDPIAAHRTLRGQRQLLIGREVKANMKISVHQPGGGSRSVFVEFLESE